MNYKFDSLDALIRQSGDILIDKDETFFDAINVADVKIAPRFSRKMHRMIRLKFWENEYKQLILVSKRIAAAFLISCTILFSLSMSIGAVREAIWKTVVEWFDKYISISYVSEEATPTTIEEKREPTYLPEKYEKEVKVDSPLLYWIEYNLNGDKIFSYQQKLSTDQINLIDNENCILTYLEINTHEAVLLEYTGNAKYYSINWNDGEYSYIINCYDANMISDVLINIAEQIK